MYTVTDNSYTHQDLPAGHEAPPSDTSQVDAIHNIFQKMQEKQFNVPKEHRENPIVIQAKLKSDALQAYEHDYESRWGITKFFLFLVRHLPFINIKFNLEKKADQILKDTGRLY